MTDKGAQQDKISLTAPARFLNLDLVLRSNSDLTPIIRYFGERVIVLTHEESNGNWILVLELADDPAQKEPAVYTERFLAMMSKFPEDVREFWEACTSRTFSYGFDGGVNSAALDTTIKADLLMQISRFGADIGITVYPFRQP